ALKKMRDFVSGDLPHALVMKGGGVKGLAFAGALMELEKYFRFDRHVGTSAGAIAAVLLAAGYTPSELKELLLRKDFKDFMDAPGWKVPLNLLFYGGFYPGEACRLWIAELLTKKKGLIEEVPMSALNGALVYAARYGSGTIAFDSRGARKESPAAFAARCSMSIPLFFYPERVDGRRVYDGGLRLNFPLTRYLADEPRSDFVALYLGRPDNANDHWWGWDQFNIVIEGEERQTVTKHRDKCVVIDTSPIGTTNFSLTEAEKEFLLLVGRAAALRFLLDRKFDDGPTEGEIKSAEAAA